MPCNSGFTCNILDNRGLKIRHLDDFSKCFYKQIIIYDHILRDKKKKKSRLLVPW